MEMDGSRCEQSGERSPPQDLPPRPTRDVDFKSSFVFPRHGWAIKNHYACNLSGKVLLVNTVQRSPATGERSVLALIGPLQQTLCDQLSGYVSEAARVN